MTVRSNITAADYSAFVRCVHRRISKEGGTQIVRWLIIASVGVSVSLISAVFYQIRFSLPSFGLGAAATLTWIILVSRLHAKRMTPAENGFVLGAQQTTIGDEGIRQKSKLHEAVYSWSAVREVETTDQYAFVFLDRIAAIILPRVAFDSSVEMDQFIAEIRRRSNSERGSSSGPEKSQSA